MLKQDLEYIYGSGFDVQASVWENSRSARFEAHKLHSIVGDVATHETISKKKLQKISSLPHEKQ